MESNQCNTEIRAGGALPHGLELPPELGLGFNPFEGIQFNFSLEDASNATNDYKENMDEIRAILEGFKNKNPVFSPAFLNAIIVVYIVLIVAGIVANTMVWLVVVLRAQMRTPRNFYVVNLTVSDVAMCVISMPFTLIHFIQMEWNFGTILCKLVPVVQGTNIFVSTGTIMAIALDRYLTIVRNCSSAQSKCRVLGTIGLIWIVSLLLNCPILFYQILEEVKECLGNGMLGEINISHCIERWPSPTYRAFYTIGLLCFQVVIPLVVLGSVHMAIANHLNAHTLALRAELKSGPPSVKRSLLRYRRKKSSHKRLSETAAVMLEGVTISTFDDGKSNICCAPPPSSLSPTANNSPSKLSNGGPAPTLTPTSIHRQQNHHFPLPNSTPTKTIDDHIDRNGNAPNIKFNADLGKCITFREFCQISSKAKQFDRRAPSANNSVEKSFSSSVATDQLTLSTETSLRNEPPLSDFNRPKKRSSQDSNASNSSSGGCSNNLMITSTTAAAGENNILCFPGHHHQIHQMTTATVIVDPGISSVVTTTSTSPTTTTTTAQRVPPTAAVTKRNKKELQRNRKTTMILLSVTVIYTISWMPWHLITLFADLNRNFAEPNVLYANLAVCHIIAMSSAFTNAILYGWLNTNLRREIIKMFFFWIKK